MDINIKLGKNFTTAYNKMQNTYGEEFSKLNGFSDEQLSYTDFISNFIDTETIADVSTDSSSNVKNKGMVTLLGEMSKSHKKLLGFHKLYHEINKKYGFQTANKWLELEWTKALYMHDASSVSFLPYCFSYDLKDLAEKGLFFLENFNYEPAKHLDTFVAFVKEFISFVSNLSSGACGLPSLIPYMYYFWKKDIEDDYYTRTPEKYAKQQIQSFIYAVNQPYVRDNVQTAFTNTSIFDREYLEALFGGSTFPDGSFMIDEIEGIMQFQKWYMEARSEILHKNMYTFPVNTISLIRKDGVFADEDFAKWAIKHNMEWSDSNLFQDQDVTSLSNCCRLRGDIEELGYYNSIGGTALKVGSVKVSTVNLARLALEYDNEEDYLVALRDVTEINLKALDRVRHIIKRNYEKGLLKNFESGLMEFKYLYNTLGILGIYETMKSFGYTKSDEFGNTYYTPEADKFGKKIFQVIHNTKDLFALDKEYKINLEQIPGETAAAVMQRADALFYPDKVVDDLPLYGNQFLPLGIKATLQERIRVASLFDSYCNGGRRKLSRLIKSCERIQRCAA